MAAVNEVNPSAPADALLVPFALDLDAVFADFDRDGYARLGRLASFACLDGLRARADAIMLGQVTYPDLFFQLDVPSGRYEELTFGKGWEGPSLAYRKIEKLERDPLFRAWIENPVFERLARRRLGDEVTLYRAVLFTKGKDGGSNLPWHQDGGLFWGLDRTPELQIWTALDDAPLGAGCLEVLPGSHLQGLATPLGGVVPKIQLAARNAEPEVVSLAARAGDVILIHNCLWHRSGVNTSGHTRRAFTACYLHGDTRCVRKKRAPREFMKLFQRSEK